MSATSTVVPGGRQSSKLNSSWATIEFVGRNGRGQQWADEELLLSLLHLL